MFVKLFIGLVISKIGKFQNMYAAFNDLWPSTEFYFWNASKFSKEFASIHFRKSKVNVKFPKTIWKFLRNFPCIGSITFLEKLNNFTKLKYWRWTENPNSYKFYFLLIWNIFAVHLANFGKLFRNIWAKGKLINKFKWLQLKWNEMKLTDSSWSWKK